MHLRLRTILVAAAIGIGVIATPGVASANASDTPGAIAARIHAQHPDISDEQLHPYCPPWQSNTVFDWHTGGDITYCSNEVYVPHVINPPKPPIWMFWVWGPELIG